MNVVRLLRYSTRGPSKLRHHFAEAIVKQLQESLAVLSPELVPVHKKLVTLRRQLVTLAAKEGSQKAELKPLQEELRRIDSLSTSPNSPCLLPLFILGAWPPCYSLADLFRFSSSQRLLNNAWISDIERVWMANFLAPAELSHLLRPFVLPFWKSVLK